MSDLCGNIATVTWKWAVFLTQNCFQYNKDVYNSYATNLNCIIKCKAIKLLSEINDFRAHLYTANKKTRVLMNSLMASCSIYTWKCFIECEFCIESNPVRFSNFVTNYINSQKSFEGLTDINNHISGRRRQKTESNEYLQDENEISSTSRIKVSDTQNKRPCHSSTAHIYCLVIWCCHIINTIQPTWIDDAKYGGARCLSRQNVPSYLVCNITRQTENNSTNKSYAK